MMAYPHHDRRGPRDSEQHASLQSRSQLPSSTVRRVTSFEVGDESPIDGAGLQGQRVGPGQLSHSNSPAVTTQHLSNHSHLSHSPSSRQHVGRSFSQAHQTYNPQDYAHTMPSPLSSSSQSSNNISRNYTAAAYQPYNPAAYQEPNLSRNSPSVSHHYSSSAHGSPQSPYRFAPTYTPHQGLNYPANHANHDISERDAAYHGSSASPSPPFAMPSSAFYTPPPPPPVPALPSRGTNGINGWRDETSRQPYAYQSPIYGTPSAANWSGNGMQAPSYSGRVPPRHNLIPGLREHEYSPFYISTGQAGTYAPIPPPHAAYSTGAVERHPQSRPLPGPPVEEPSSLGYGTDVDTNLGLTAQSRNEAEQDHLFEEVENAVLQTGREPRRVNGLPDRVGAAWDNCGTQSSLEPNSVDNSSANSDLVDEAGMEALRRADAQDKAEEAQRDLLRNSGNETPQTGIDRQYTDPEADYTNIDVELISGGYPGSMAYGPDISAFGMVNGAIDGGHEIEQFQTATMHQGHADSDDFRNYGTGGLHPSSDLISDARVDTFGTGGLAEPSDYTRRLSFDEGDEDDWIDEQGGPPELFYHPGITQRPLPQPPSETPETVNDLKDSESHRLVQNGMIAAEALFPVAPDSFSMSATTGSIGPRATSLVSRSHTPPAITPIRAKTDAEERRQRQQQQRNFGNADLKTESSTPQSTSSIALDLPSLPAGKRFVPAKLTINDFRKCTEPWALSSLSAWLKLMAEGEQDLREHTVFDGLVALIIHKVPTLNIANAETLSGQVIKELYKAGTLIQDEEWVKLGSETTSGVIYQLTGTGCYSPKLHENSFRGRCYSRHCQRTLKKLDLSTPAAQSRSDDWRTFYELKHEDLAKANKSDIDRQNILHEIVVTEDGFMDQLNVLRIVYRDAIATSQPPIIAPKRLGPFLLEVFGKVDPIKAANESHLLPQLKYRQKEQGPWIVGFSDIFREWVRKAKHAYVEYAAGFPRANFLIRQEVERNVLFRDFLEKARSHRLSSKLGWDTYLKAPITRLQRYGLLLSTVYKTMPESEEKKNLQIVLDEIRAVTMECDAIVAEMGRKVDLADLQSKLIMRPGMPRVDLNLDHLGRCLIYKGDLLRLGTNKFTWLETHALLFDNFLVVAKSVKRKDPAGSWKFIGYDVSRLPIPMDLLMLESADDDPIVKSRGITTAVAGVTRAQASTGNLNNAPGSSLSTSTTGSAASTAVVVSTGNDQSAENVLYPFRIRHLGTDGYTLYASSAQNRKDWCEKIVEAKTKHAASLFAQNAEPFRLRVMADAAFSYEGGVLRQRGFLIKGTPLYRAIREMEKQHEASGRPGPVCRARVNCATTFQRPRGQMLVAVGCDNGVYTSNINNPRNWQRALPIQRVTQIAVLEEFNLFILISDKSVVAYHLDQVCPLPGASTNDSGRRAPQKLSGSRDVGFFATGKMKDRMLVLYKKKDGILSIFKVLEPVYQKATERKSRFGRFGTTELFREYDGFYTPAECYGMNLFHSYVSLSTSKGFEVLTLDKKQPISVPDLKQSHVASIASRLADQNPLGMFRLSDQEFLLCYNECAVYVNKHGDISRSVIMSFVGKARNAAMYGRYVLLFDQDFVEIRNAQNGRLRQIISGKDIKCLDDGLNGSSAGHRTIKLCMQHPEQDRSQLILELLLNEGQSE